MLCQKGPGHFHPFQQCRAPGAGQRGFNAYRVAEWSGNTNVDRIKDHYAPRARALKEAYGEDWLQRAFRKLSGG